MFRQIHYHTLKDNNNQILRRRSVGFAYTCVRLYV